MAYPGIITNKVFKMIWELFCCIVVTAISVEENLVKVMDMIAH